jgi:hypothetical protein
MPRLTALLLLASLLAATAACDRSEGPQADSPAAAALALFELAGADPPPEEELGALFGSALDELQRASLLEALAAIADASEPTVVRTEPLSGLDRVAVDLSAAAPAGGRAEFSVQLQQAAGGEWQISWFQGPGVEWPRRGRPRGTGLTTSALPNEEDGR